MLNTGKGKVYMKRDGFEVAIEKFRGVIDTIPLPPELKRPVTIANLFSEHYLPIKDIMRVLDESYENVVLSLISQRAVQDRRRHLARIFQGVDRRRKLSNSQQ